MKECVTVEEMQRHMRDYFQKQKERRKTVSKPFKGISIQRDVEPKQTPATPEQPPSSFNSKASYGYVDGGLLIALTTAVMCFLYLFDPNIRVMINSFIIKGLGQLQTVSSEAFAFCSLIIILCIIIIISKRR